MFLFFYGPVWFADATPRTRMDTATYAWSTLLFYDAIKKPVVDKFTASECFMVFFLTFKTWINDELPILRPISTHTAGSF